MKTTILAALLSLAFAAQAETVRPPPTGFPPKPIVVEVPAPPMQQQQQQGQQQTTNVRTGNTSLKSEANLSVTSVHQAQERDPVSSAYAPSINPTANCAVPVVAGVQVTGFGLSGGSAYESDTCVTIEQAKVATHTFGDVATGEALMCGLKKYRDARKLVKRPCPGDEAASAKADEPTDPYVRRRLGLPAL